MTAPYYENDGVTLYLGDCLEITEWLAADVLVTDPPYGMAYESNLNRDQRNTKVGRPILGDHSPAFRDAVLAAWGDRPAIAFGTWRVQRPDAAALLVWHKVGAGGLGDLSMPWIPTHEEIYVRGSGFVGKRSDSVIQCAPLMSQDSRRPDHPTPKPVALMERLIESCPPEWVIADPFAGSGSTLVAARNLGRKAIGVEIEERYCEIIARRLDQAVLPL